MMTDQMKNKILVICCFDAMNIPTKYLILLKYRPLHARINNPQNQTKQLDDDTLIH